MNSNHTTYSKSCTWQKLDQSYSSHLTNDSNHIPQTSVGSEKAITINATKLVVNFKKSADESMALKTKNIKGNLQLTTFLSVSVMAFKNYTSIKWIECWCNRSIKHQIIKLDEERLPWAQLREEKGAMITRVLMQNGKKMDV